MDLKPGQVRIFQCEACGEIFDPSHQDSKAGWHLGVEVVADEHGDPEPQPFQCGPVRERIMVEVGRQDRDLEPYDTSEGCERVRQGV